MESAKRMSKQQTILVTGGAGYIGSHVVLQLVAQGERVVVLDDLSTGFADAVIGAELVVGNVGDSDKVEKLLQQWEIDTVMHFAARTIVPESVADPLRYYGNNTCATRNLLASCAKGAVRHIVFSSTAAVYGEPAGGIAREDSATAPINPYGTSKLMSEWMLRDLTLAGGPAHVALRYFNVAGCDVAGRIGQSTANATLLTKVACEAALGVRPHVCIFGTDYDTIDGTGVRDYIHVVDLARGHIAAIDALKSLDRSFVVNLGTGQGYSVLDVVKAFEAASGRRVPYELVARRPGDVAACYADPAAAEKLIGWRAQYGIERMCADHWRWQSQNPRGFE